MSHSFQMTQAIHDQIVTFQLYHTPAQASLAQYMPEPFNPWPELMGQMVTAISGLVSCNNDEELCADYIEHHGSDNDFYDHIRARYKVGAIDAQSVIEQLKPFTALRNY